jgi:hypothetical protein
MRNPETAYQFSNGKLSPMSQLPEWLLDAMIAEREHEDNARALSDQGAEKVESYGTLNETVDVWRRTGSGWLVDWWDTDSHVMSIVVTTALDFALFQVFWICPMAAKIMAADLHIRANAGAQAAEERSTSAVH